MPWRNVCLATFVCYFRYGMKARRDEGGEMKEGGGMMEERMYGEEEGPFVPFS